MVLALQRCYYVQPMPPLPSLMLCICLPAATIAGSMSTPARPHAWAPYLCLSTMVATIPHACMQPVPSACCYSFSAAAAAITCFPWREAWSYVASFAVLASLVPLRSKPLVIAEAKAAAIQLARAKTCAYFLSALHPRSHAMQHVRRIVYTNSPPPLLVLVRRRRANKCQHS